ncbi:hypothetical protein M8013_14405 [Enterobacteriaceae bacterium H4N4]|uniref:Uncharacterized protein n=1 Tax=Silvania confinis TaxID=2926470 RepID=A0A9J6QBN7_9ENTR|nr:hypothetical protein [Silvania confinis]MCU6669935.1 hypothetical protein [Silvania confinis]
MKFSELPEDSKYLAREALSNAAASMDGDAGIAAYERLGEAVAAAFVSMERYDGAPEKCDYGTGS